MSEKVYEIDDSSFVRITKEAADRLREQGIERQGPPDFDAIAAQWKARRAASEEASALGTYRFVLIVQPDDGQFRASAPTLDGCEARGATPEEARERLLKALYARLTEMLASGETPPSDEGAEIVNVVVPVPSR
jgi:predicted RNase H-like HicB family nuclease